MECICRQVTSVHWQKAHRAGTLPGTCRRLVSQHLDSLGPGFVPRLGFLPHRVQKQVGTEACQTQSQRTDRNFYTWGPRRARDFSGAARGPPHGQPVILEGMGLVRVQDKAPLPGAGSGPDPCFSRQQHRRGKAGPCFHHSLSAKRYRLFSAGSVGQSRACSSFIELRALLTAGFQHL